MKFLTEAEVESLMCALRIQGGGRIFTTTRELQQWVDIAVSPRHLADDSRRARRSEQKRE